MMYKANFTFQALPIKKGFLTKKGHRRRNWKVRYFVLEKNKLSYFAQPKVCFLLSLWEGAKYLWYFKDRSPKGVVPLHKSTLVKLAPEMKKSNCFTVSIPTKPYVFYIQAPTGEEMMEWMEAIQEAKNWSDECCCLLCVTWSIIWKRSSVGGWIERMFYELNCT